MRAAKWCAARSKAFDARIPVFDDVLPHALPILAYAGADTLSLASLAIEGGGARMRIAANGQAPAVIRLARNGKSRHRILTVRTAVGRYLLDFSCEPGTVTALDGAPHNADPDWGSAPGPLAAMLSAFWNAARGGGLDHRLSPDIALASAVFADAVRARYLPMRQSWVSENRGTAEDFAYAAAELKASGQGWRTARSAHCGTSASTHLRHRRNGRTRRRSIR